MNQTEKRCWLIKELQADMPEYGALTIPETPEEQKKRLRSLMNVRPPKPVSQAFLQIQDESVSYTHLTLPTTPYV